MVKAVTEILLGYERFYPAHIWSKSLFQAIQVFFLSQRNSRLSMLELLNYCLHFSFYPLRAWSLRRRFSFLKPEFLKRFDAVRKMAKNYLSIFELQKMEILSIPRPQLLRYEDRNSMRHSVEARLPFLDYKLVETALSLNNSFKIKNGWTKYVLRMAMSEVLPEKVIWRKNKIGFNAPEDTWIEAIFTEIVTEIKNSKIIQSVRNMESLSKGWTIGHYGVYFQSPCGRGYIKSL